MANPNTMIIITIIIIMIVISLLFGTVLQNKEYFVSGTSSEHKPKPKPKTESEPEPESEYNSSTIQKIKYFTKENSLYRPVTTHMNNPIVNNLQIVKKNVIKLLSETPNLSVKEQFFTKTINDKKYSFSNIIANPTNFNDSKPYIILGAHIDGPHEQIGTPASLDAIVSIGIIIELGKMLLKNIHDYNLQIVFFDGEEAIDGPWSNSNTLSGSKYFVQELKTTPSQVFIFDLIGGDIEKNKLYAYSLNPKSHLLMSKLAWINNDLYPENKRIFVDPNLSISYSIIKDDSVPFYNKNIPVLDLIPPLFPSSHHTIQDNYQNVNWTYVEIFYNVMYNYLLKNPVKF